MPNLPAPVKTPLGLDELRHRTRGLGQRYRTVLLLVDGRRPLGEILGMAHQAGAQTSHFEELVRMGLVDVPSVAAALEPMETLPGALDTPRLTSVELDVFADAALTPMGELLPDEDEDDDALATSTMPRSEEAFDDAVTAFNEVELPRARYVEPEVQLSATPRVPDWVQQAREAPFKLADHARAAPKMSDEQRLQYVRDLLLDTVRRDSIFATFSLGRVRSAITHKDLIKLVWELERDRGHARRNRDQLLNLQRARELLGMGNTLVAGDTQPGEPSEF